MIQEVAGYDPGRRRTEIGRRVREARIQHHLTQTEVAEMLGCSRIKLNRVENGKADLTALELDLLAYAFQLPVAFFFSTEGGLVQRIVWSSEPERGLIK